MASTQSRHRSKLRSTESAAVSHGIARNNDDGNDTIVLQLSIRRGYLAVIAIVAFAVLAVLMLVFSHQGVKVHGFIKGELTTTEQTHLLDKYNSYSGLISTAIGRPFNVVVTLLVNILLLRAMTATVLQVEQRSRVQYIALAVSTVFGYMLANGLSALNVQMFESSVQAVIGAEDLLWQRSTNGSSTVKVSYPDDQPNNPTTNTILRNLILPSVPMSSNELADAQSMDAYDSVQFGIPQRPWMSNLLTTALDAKTMQFDINFSNLSANSKRRPDEFPMKASEAADLLLYGLLTSFFPFQTEVTSHTWGFVGLGPMNRSVAPVAKLAGLLPPKVSTSEQEDREWFVQHSAVFVKNSTSRNASSLLKSTIKLSHVDITPSIWMNAVTIEREYPIFAPYSIQEWRSVDGKTRYITTSAVSSEGTHVSISTGNDTTDAKIDMNAVCLDDEGNEVLTARADNSSSAIFWNMRCPNKSASSLLFVSTTKRLIADSLTSNGTKGNATMTNLREVIISTFARLSWKLSNLSTIFGAMCADSSGCMGLDIDLPSVRQRLVVSANGLPVAQAPRRSISPKAAETSLKIVSVTRPQHYYEYKVSDETRSFGCYLMSHNVRALNVTPASAGARTIDAHRLRLENYVNNHVYMDSTLQATYTAATFALFANGIAYDVISRSNRLLTLAFSHNVQRVDLRASIPQTNVVVTLAGCGLLLVALVVAFARSYLAARSSPDPLQRITAPHTIASAFVGVPMFSSALLQSSVRSPGEFDARDVEKLAIKSITLEPKTDDADETEQGDTYSRI